jgi:hypothetical protein
MSRPRNPIPGLLAAAALLLALPGAAVASDGDLWTYGTAGTADQQQAVMAGTSPSIAGLTTGGYEIAFQPPSGALTVTGDDGNQTLALGMAPGTNPAIAALPGGSWQTAFQANNNVLWTAGGADVKDWGLAMMPGTSPSITGLTGGGYETAFQGTTGGYLWTAGTADTTNNLRGLDAHSSPSITAVGSSYEMAFEANTDVLFTASPGTYNQSQYGMSGTTSPSIAGLAGGGYEYAFEAYGTDDLWTYGTLEGGDTGLKMAPGTGPGIAALAQGGYEVAYQSANGDLSLYGSAGPADTGLTMAPGTSPSISGLSTGGYEVGFQAKPVPVTPVVTTPIPTPVPTPAPSRPGSGRRQLRVKIELKWTWDLRHTRLAKVRVGRRPRSTMIRFLCQGRGCPKGQTHGAAFRKLRPLQRSIVGSRYRPGDRLFVRVTASGYKAERVELLMRRDTLPAVKLL